MSDPKIFDEYEFYTVWNPDTGNNVYQKRLGELNPDEAMWVIDLYRSYESDAATNARLWALNKYPDDCRFRNLLLENNILKEFEERANDLRRWLKDECFPNIDLDYAIRFAKAYVGISQEIPAARSRVRLLLAEHADDIEAAKRAASRSLVNSWKRIVKNWQRLRDAPTEAEWRRHLVAITECALAAADQEEDPTDLDDDDLWLLAEPEVSGRAGESFDQI